jgi:NAD(P)-dependent dehydrogenase (short-subunit alcohol dehydrogenase family)
VKFVANRFTGQVVIVTGGSRGIGRAIVEGLAAEDAHVIVVGLNASRGQTAAQEISRTGGQVTFMQADVSQQEMVEALIAQILHQYDHIDVLINNAAIHESAPFCEESAELWDRLFQVNVMGTVFPSQAVVRHMQSRGGGSIVHIASKAGVVGEPGHAAYSASKGAIISLTRAMAVELAPYAIRVNAICPGPVATDMLREVIPGEEDRNALASATPLGRIGVPEDIAGAVLYFASPDSGWCTGQILSLDGGLSILK